jgi:hypothetical protein
VEHGLDLAEAAFGEQLVEVVGVDVVGDLQVGRLRNLSPCVRSSTAMMSSMPRALRPLTMLLPMKPAAPVTTTRVMRTAPRN